MTLQPLLSLHISYTCSFFFIFFFFNDTPTTEIYTLSLHDALPISLAVYRVTKRFPADERYGLTSQTRRAAFSAAVNIVDRKSTRLNSSHVSISYAVFCLKKKKKKRNSLVSRF